MSAQLHVGLFWAAKRDVPTHIKPTGGRALLSLILSMSVALRALGDQF
jgi:hypothetical protein